MAGSASPSCCAKLNKVEGIEWIRVLYAYPIHFTDELIETLAETPKIIPYLDMPLQHINDRMLKRMQRRVNRAETEELLARLRQAIPEPGAADDVHRRLPRRDRGRVRGAVRLRASDALRAGRRLSLFAGAGHAGGAAAGPSARRGQAASGAIA